MRGADAGGTDGAALMGKKKVGARIVLLFLCSPSLSFG